MSEYEKRIRYWLLARLPGWAVAWLWGMGCVLLLSCAALGIIGLFVAYMWAAVNAPWLVFAFLVVVVGAFVGYLNRHDIDPRKKKGS